MAASTCVRDSAIAGAVLSSIPLAGELFLSSCFGTRKRNDDFIIPFLFLGRENKRVRRAKIVGFVKDVVPRYTDHEFRRHFRLRRETVEVLLQTFGERLSKSSLLGRPGIDLTTTVLLPIWTLANQESFRGVSDRFGVGEGHAYRLFVNFCNVLASRVNVYIVWPIGNEIEKKVCNFESIGAKAFPGVVGCVDGSYIPIKGKKSEGASYCTRKGFKAITLQAVCDADLAFTDIFVGWPGSSHDARVWKNSPLCKRLSNEPDLLPEHRHILGDSAYPLTEKLLKPYRDNGFLTPCQKYFNLVLSSTRGKIENAFAHLKSRFRRLKYLDMIRLDRASKVVSVACILHNICVLQQDFLDPSDVFQDENLIQALVHVRDTTQNGIIKRDRIAQQLFANK